MNKTGIEYLTHTWNPLAMRCTRVSPACDHCWHLAMAHRMAKNPKLSQEVRDALSGETGPVLLKSRLDEPMSRKIPSVIGVQFMGDLFHRDVPLARVFDVFAMMEQCKQHTFLILTKRVQEMAVAIRLWYEDSDMPGALAQNIWLGVTAENQEQWDKRVSILRQIPAVAHFVSIEPMLSEINMHMISSSGYKMLSRWYGPNGFDPTRSQPEKQRTISQVIVGGETDPGARPMHPAWVRSIRDQCIAADIPLFFKGWGEWRQARSWSSRGHRKGVADIEGIGDVAVKWKNHTYVDGDLFFRIGAKLVGNVLDGKVWQQFPEAKDGRPD